ncbi:L domain-like protein [Backusella circina FSU 941]|nr:L domain-like protein [Backusella circina FSU 941]
MLKNKFYILFVIFCILIFVIADDEDDLDTTYSESISESVFMPMPTYSSIYEDASLTASPTQSAYSVNDSAPPIDIHNQDTETTTNMSSAHHIVSSSVCNALKIWYNSLHGDNWVIKTGWDSSDMSSCCSWYSVHCNSLGQVLKINLAHNNVVGQLPNNFNQLLDLQNIDLSYNNLSGPLPDTIANLSKLQSFNFDYNHISGSLPFGLGNLVNLTNIHLKNNSITGTIPNDWVSMKSILSIYLSNNNLAGPLPDIISQLATVQTL